MNSLDYSLPPKLDSALQQSLHDWQQQDSTARLWQRDSSLWTGADEAEWLGWLDIVQQSLDGLNELHAVVRTMLDDGIRQVVLLGMGGSSMAPEVLRDTFGCQPAGRSRRGLDVRTDVR